MASERAKKIEEIAKQNAHLVWAPHTTTERNDTAVRERLNLVTWNCSNLKTATATIGGTHPLQTIVTALNAKIILLQETKERHKHRHAKIENMRGYTCYFSSLPANTTRSGKPREDIPVHQKHNRAGVSILAHNSLNPTQNMSRIQEPNDLQGYAICLRWKTTRGTLLLVNAYLPPPEHTRDTHNQELREETRHRIMRQISGWITAERRTGEPVIMGGDMNAAWYPHDRRRTARLNTEDKKYMTWAKQQQLRPADTLHTRNPQRQTTFESRSTTDDNNMTGTTSRIDDWLVSVREPGAQYQAELPRITETHHDLTHTSDHHPLTLTLDAHQLGIDIDDE